LRVFDINGIETYSSSASNFEVNEDDVIENLIEFKTNSSREGYIFFINFY
jgi:hypothetical protein